MGVIVVQDGCCLLPTTNHCELLLRPIAHARVVARLVHGDEIYVRGVGISQIAQVGHCLLHCLLHAHPHLHIEHHRAARGGADAYLSIKNRSAATTLSSAVFDRYGTAPRSFGATFWNPGVKTEKIAKKREKTGQKWARYGLKRVKESGSAGIPPAAGQQRSLGVQSGGWKAGLDGAPRPGHIVPRGHGPGPGRLPGDVSPPYDNSAGVREPEWSCTLVSIILALNDIGPGDGATVLVPVSAPAAK